MAAPNNPTRPCAASPPLPMPARLVSAAGYRQSVQDRSQRAWHEGADFAAEIGTPVLAVRPGLVHAVFGERERRTHGYGKLVVLYHPEDAIYSAYAHLSEVFVAPMQGEEIVAGTVLGAAGDTSGGRFPRMGAHLHLAMRRPRRNGRAPWPGGYPDPDRSPALHREVWVDPLAHLARFGLVIGARGELVITSGSPADCGQGWAVRPTIAGAWSSGGCR
jgi:murein DD-endopeptidase MepM/ murein hydrolase activator NlpD